MRAAPTRRPPTRRSPIRTSPYQALASCAELAALSAAERRQICRLMGRVSYPAGTTIVKVRVRVRVRVRIGVRVRVRVTPNPSPNPNIKGAYPKGVNAQDARIKFRKRKPRLGGADETLLGVGGSEWPPLEHTQRTDALGLPACLVTLSCG